jgi:hypothetical protein
MGYSRLSTPTMRHPAEPRSHVDRFWKRCAARPHPAFVALIPMIGAPIPTTTSSHTYRFVLIPCVSCAVAACGRFPWGFFRATLLTTVSRAQDREGVLSLPLFERMDGTWTSAASSPLPVLDPVIPPELVPSGCVYYKRKFELYRHVSCTLTDTKTVRDRHSVFCSPCQD